MQSKNPSSGKKKKGGKAKTYEVLKGNAVILFLYLLHQSDYSYNIKNTFAAIHTDINKGKIRPIKDFPKALTHSSNVYPILNKLEKAGFIKVEMEEKKKPWLKPSKVYSVDLSLFLDNLPPSSREEINYGRLLEQFIQKKYPGKKKCLKKILSLKKLDYLTILAYLRSFLGDTLNYNNEDFSISPPPFTELIQKAKKELEELKGLKREFENEENLKEWNKIKRDYEELEEKTPPEIVGISEIGKELIEKIEKTCTKDITIEEVILEKIEVDNHYRNAFCNYMMHSLDSLIMKTIFKERGLPSSPSLSKNKGEKGII